MTESAEDVNLFANLFEKFSLSINDPIDKLQSSLNESRLPEPTPPDSSGVAFEKFLAIYRQLNDSSAPLGNQLGEAAKADNLGILA